MKSTAAAWMSAPRGLHQASFPEKPSSPFRDLPLSSRPSRRSLLLSPQLPFSRSRLSNPPSALLTLGLTVPRRGAVLGMQDVQQHPWSRPGSTSHPPNPERGPALLHLPRENCPPPQTVHTMGALGRPPTAQLQIRSPGPTHGQ